MGYGDILKKVLGEKVQLSYIQTKFREAMKEELNGRKSLNHPEINVSRLKTIFDQKGKPVS